jgi:MYXO-CTERM domain-containing protein
VVAGGAPSGGPIRDCPDLVWGSLPPAGSPDFPDRETLCASIPGEPLPPDLLPPEDLVSVDEQNAYAERLRAEFLLPRRYATELGWAGDARWRLSGDIQGCPSDNSFVTFGVHLLVRVWYSPEVVEWLCGDRSTELPVGATIVKEEHLFQGNAVMSVDPKTHRLAASQDLTPDIFTFMIKRPSAAWDGYYWGAINAEESGGNPPVDDRAGLTSPAPAHLPPHEPPYFPTGASNGAPSGAAVYANFGYGMYCVNCHSAANSEMTFSSLDNILGNEAIFSWRGRGSTPRCNGDEVVGPPIDPGAGLAVVGRGCPPALPPAPLNAPDPFFLALYDEVEPVSDDQVWNGLDLATGDSPPKVEPLRYPAAQSWDRSVMPASERPRTFITSDQCAGCHDGIRNNGVLPYMVVFDRDGRLRNLSPGSEWRNSSMGLAGRDPIFMARMEAEWNAQERNFAKVPGLGNAAAPTVADCVMDFCLSCHAKAGHQQQSIDTRGTGTDPLPGSVLQVQNTYICRDLLPPPLGSHLKSKEDGHEFFVRPNLQNWPGTPDVTRDELRAASLGRDGVTCLACHLAGPDVGNPADGFTGNIPYALDGVLFAPDEIDSPGEVMDAAIGLKPQRGDQLKESRLCGACHAINLPVIRSGDCTTNPETSPFAGCVKEFKYEQTTYFEYLNSAYNEDSASAEPRLVRECQGCHMDNGHSTSNKQDLAFKVANIQDDSFYRYDNSRPPEYLALPVRDDYRRHVFPGLNLFLNAFQQQFPLLLGHADLDWMNITPEMGVLTQRDVLLEFAREKTARITVENLRSTSDGLRAAVRVKNLTGHNLPSGVGFRRLFIEFSVLDATGNVLWASGRTDSLGQLLGADGAPLPFEHYPSAVYEPHHQVIRSADDVQIYEEVVTDDLGVVTTGFLNRWYDKKDNRIPPRGFRWDSMYVHAPYDVAPKGEAEDDPQYARADVTVPLDGEDEITYDIALPPALRAQARTVRARLISQSIPPYFLSQIFAELAMAKADPALVASDNQLIVDGSFLHYLASRFDASAVNADGEAYLEDWKLEIAADQQALGASSSDDDGCAVVAPADGGPSWLLVLPAAALVLLRRRRQLPAA